MFKKNEQLIIRYLRTHPDTDLAQLAHACKIARSSTYVALQRLSMLGVIQSSPISKKGKAHYRVAGRDAVESAIHQLTREFKDVVYGPRNGHTKPTLVFSDQYSLSEPQLEQLRNRYVIRTYENSPDYLSDELFNLRSQDADIVIRFDGPTVDRAYLASHPRVKMLVCPTVFHNNIDLDACREYGVTVKKFDPAFQKYSATTEIEFLLNATLQLLKPIHAASQAATKANTWRWKDYLGYELAGKRVGIAFTETNIGKYITIFQALGCEVKATNLLPQPPLALQFGLSSYVPLDELWAESDVLMIIDKFDLSLDKYLRQPRTPSYLLVSSDTATYDLNLMRRRLLDGSIRGFATDYLPNMFATRTNEKDLQQVLRPLVNLPNVLIAPEMSVFSHESLERSRAFTFQILMELELA